MAFSWKDKKGMYKGEGIYFTYPQHLQPLGHGCLQHNAKINVMI